jgi:CubicO group peptidase (beta-lactamase class C family)
LHPANNSNTAIRAFILLAEIVKRVSGQSFADFTQSRIFTPLKMLNTRFVDDPGLIVKNKAYSYLQQDEVYYKSLLNHSFVGSTGLNTTSEDLMLWAQNFEYPVVGDEGIFNQMKKSNHAQQWRRGFICAGSGHQILQRPKRNLSRWRRRGIPLLCIAHSGASLFDGHTWQFTIL